MVSPAASTMDFTFSKLCRACSSKVAGIWPLGPPAPCPETERELPAEKPGPLGATGLALGGNITRFSAPAASRTQVRNIANLVIENFQVAVYTALWQRGILEWKPRMSELVKAIFEHGAFVPKTPCDLPEGTRVLLAVEPQGLLVRPPEVNAPEERAKILLAVVERMKRNPLPPNAPRFSRDEMH